MTDSLNLDFDDNERRQMSDFTEQAYLNYSMYVIMDRALPHHWRWPQTGAAPHCLRHE
jgi:topoisomerase-4 subunit A